MYYGHQGEISREWEGHTFQRHKWVRGKAGVSPASSELRFLLGWCYTYCGCSMGYYLRFFLGWGREMSSPDTRSQEKSGEE